jgi:hypothetical protein
MKHFYILFFLVTTVVYAQPTQAFFDDFEDGLVDDILFTNWNNIDWDGDGEFWEIADMLGYAPAHPMQTKVADSDSWEGTPFNPDNWLITKDPIDLTTFSNVMITFTVGTYQTNGTFVDDKYSIYMATTGGTIADFLQVSPIDTRLVSDDCPSTEEDGSLSGAVVEIDASAFDGQQVYLAFRHFESQDINSVLLDDITVSGDTSLGIVNPDFRNLSHFVDINGYLNIRNSIVIDEVQISSINGSVLFNEKTNQEQAQIDLNMLSKGVYLVTIYVNESSQSFKIVK